ncbi:unnamed protein product [Cylindrotheca closterium]|uniref:Mediator of RNA polymerase II transcription subunit 7 n=1 Tax=Cylindrotheca closterium TaxID=2856 RepID=A0AAD2FW05_9STRA|nr:unnamed protein product [Cylindrotheca closterium]
MSAPPADADPDDLEVEAGDGQPTLLVSEFPPAPYYYALASEGKLKPPPIPTEALARGTRKAAAAGAKARAETERLRLNDTGAILGGVQEDMEEEGDVVAVFGEIVEDPLLVEPQDYCEDPNAIAETVKKLNRQVLEDFVSLVQDLVHRPAENKVTRDQLSHNIFLMLQETNKFREHQAREFLIEVLEKQLVQRQTLLEELQEGMQHVDSIVPAEELKALEEAEAEELAKKEAEANAMQVDGGN